MVGVLPSLRFLLSLGCSGSRLLLVGFLWLLGLGLLAGGCAWRLVAMASLVAELSRWGAWASQGLLVVSPGS